MVDRGKETSVLRAGAKRGGNRLGVSGRKKRRSNERIRAGSVHRSVLESPSAGRRRRKKEGRQGDQHLLVTSRREQEARIRADRMGGVEHNGGQGKKKRNQKHEGYEEVLGIPSGRKPTRGDSKDNHSRRRRTRGEGGRAGGKVMTSLTRLKRSARSEGDCGRLIHQGKQKRKHARFLSARPDAGSKPAPSSLGRGRRRTSCRKKNGGESGVCLEEVLGRGDYAQMSPRKAEGREKKGDGKGGT